MKNNNIKTKKQLKFLLKYYDLTIAKFINGLKRKEIAIAKVQEEQEAKAQVVPKRNYYTDSDNVKKSQPSENAIIARSEMDFISRCILDYPNIETGGQLFGYWSADGTPIILYSIGPGVNSNHQVTFFNQDVEYLVRIGTILNQKYGLHHIGEWHSHHQLGLAQPSGHDASNMHSSISSEHLGRFLLCIGNCTNTHSTLNAFNFVEDNPNYVKAKWTVKEFAGINYRELIDSQETGITIPFTKKACHGVQYMTNELSSKEEYVTDYEEGYWYNSPENKKTFANIVRQIMESGSCQCQPDLDSNNYVHLLLEFRTHSDDILFPKEFPNVPPQIFRKTPNRNGYVQGDWNYNGDIEKSFFDFYQTTYEQ